MKILILNYSDTGSGATVAALNLTHSLNNANQIARLGVIVKNKNLPDVIDIRKKNSICYKIYKKGFRVFESFLFNHFETSNSIMHSLNLYSQLDIDSINKSDYDIIHLQWINNNMISIKDMSRISKPIVWTMHDSWPFCGAEHHPNILEKDKRYELPYSRNNKPHTTHGFDLCRYIYKRKKRYLSKLPITFVSPSNWERSLLSSSDLFADNECSVIHNIINQKIFHKKNTASIRLCYDLPSDKKIIGFGAAYSLNDVRSLKGGYLLVDALKQLPDKNNYQLLVFGAANESFAKELNIPIFFAGYIENSTILSSLYNCCDVFVCPSIIENLPYTCLEAMSCGVPVVAFEIGGIPDIIQHKYNGYLAKPYNTIDLCNGIEYILQNRDKLSINAIKKINVDFSEASAVDKHIALYTNILRNISK